MSKPIRVVILEDHQSTLEGYLYRLGQEPDIAVVATPGFGEELELALAEQQPVQVLILDINVPASVGNRRPYPVLHLIPKLLRLYPDLNVLVISMYKQGALIKAAIEAGASGFVLKDDRETQHNLGSVVRTVAAGGIHFSKEAHQQLLLKTVSSPQLSPRQVEVLALCASYPDKTTAEIAALLGVAETTVRNLLSASYLRLGVRSRTAAVARAEALGLTATVDTYAPLNEPADPGAPG